MHTRVEKTPTCRWHRPCSLRYHGLAHSSYLGTDLSFSEDFFSERRRELHPARQQTKDRRLLSRCRNVLKFLAEKLSEHLAKQGVIFTKCFHDPLRLMGEERLTDGTHIRRVGTTAINHGCLLARHCTYFFHRHDQVPLPQTHRVANFPLHHSEPEPSE